MKKTDIDRSLRSYMKILAYALLLFFAAGSATVYHTPYPPFGLSTVSITGPSSCLIAIGVYYSARLIASNRTIENQLRTSSKYSQFFTGIGSAEMEHAMTELIEQIRKKLPTDIDKTSQDLQLVDTEIMEFLKKYQSRRKYKNN